MNYTGNYNWKTIEIKEFAKGGNSLVYKVESNDIDGLYALKLFNDTKSNTERYNRFLSEIEIVKIISAFRGCVKYIDHGLYGEQPFYIMPYYENGTFREMYLNNNNKYTPIEKLESFQKVLQIVKSLHDKGLAIRDIKPQNILIDSNNDPILADFGLSLWITTPDEERLTTISTSVGSQGYRAPEWATSYPAPNHRPGDIWSLGRTLWAVFARKNPPDNFETLGCQSTHLKLYESKDYANLIQSIVTSCTSQSPDSRPEIDELIEIMDNVKDRISKIVKGENSKNTDLDDLLTNLSLQLHNSETYIDSKKIDYEVKIKIDEINTCLNNLNTIFNDYVTKLQGKISNDIGSFSIYNRKWELMFVLNSVGLEIDYADNNSCNKSIELSFFPTTSLRENKKIKTIAIKIYLGLTKTQKFYWVVTTKNDSDENIKEQFETISIATLVQQKINCMDKIINEHFVQAIEQQFKA